MRTVGRAWRTPASPGKWKARLRRVPFACVGTARVTRATLPLYEVYRDHEQGYWA